MANVIRETILELRAGEAAPPGYELRRILGTYEPMIGSNTNTETIYVVAAALVDSEGTA
jgi:hypothetical protein